MGVIRKVVLVALAGAFILGLAPSAHADYFDIEGEKGDHSMPAYLSELADADLYPYEQAWSMVERVCSVLASGGTELGAARWYYHHGFTSHQAAAIAGGVSFHFCPTYEATP